MASGTIMGDDGGAGNSDGDGGKQRWTDSSKVYARKSFRGLKTGTENDDLDSNMVVSDPLSHNVSTSEGFVSSNGMAKQGSSNWENIVKINLDMKSKQELRELRKKLKSELTKVRSLVRKLDDQRGFGNFATNNVFDNGGSIPVHQLNVSTIEHCQGLNDNPDKEKRTPKTNPHYRNSEFLLAKDKFPPQESSKKLKSSGKKRVVPPRFGAGSKFFNRCTGLLERLMKHKLGWVFNEPVNAKALGLHDYFTIIKHPMDLGTIKTRLNTNWYNSPMEFAEDVRLTFRNAMTYNLVGQDVHTMAAQLALIFEEKWMVTENEYNRDLKVALDYDAGLPTPTSRKAPQPPSLPPLEVPRTLDRSESITHPVNPKSKSMKISPPSKTPTLKKPKAKDPNKRDMTFEEKQKLSTNLQGLPSEKLDNIVQIIKKRNSALSQNDDEIEIDIDNVDNETLWELDRFVTYYKKGLSTNKKKAEQALQAKQNVQEKVPASDIAQKPQESKTDENYASLPSLVHGDKHGDNENRSSSSSSSSSGSDSSSSDSDSDSSSADGSGANLSPKT